MFPGLRRLKRITNYAVNKRNQDLAEDNDVQIKRKAEGGDDKISKRKSGAPSNLEERKELAQEDGEWDEVEEGYQYEDKFDDEYGNSPNHISLTIRERRSRQSGS
jgi:hypothetical protein